MGHNHMQCGIVISCLCFRRFIQPQLIFHMAITEWLIVTDINVYAANYMNIKSNACITLELPLVNPYCWQREHTVNRPFSLKYWLKNTCYTDSMVYKERRRKKTNLNMKALALKGTVNCWYLYCNSNLYEPSLNKKLSQTSYSTIGFWGCFIVFLATF